MQRVTRTRLIENTCHLFCSDAKTNYIHSNLYLHLKIKMLNMYIHCNCSKQNIYIPYYQNIFNCFCKAIRIIYIVKYWHENKNHAKLCKFQCVSKIAYLLICILMELSENESVQIYNISRREKYLPRAITFFAIILWGNFLPHKMKRRQLFSFSHVKIPCFCIVYMIYILIKIRQSYISVHRYIHIFICCYWYT